MSQFEMPWYSHVELRQNPKQEFPIKHVHRLEPGTILIAHPRVQQSDLHRAVFLVLKHDEDTTIAVQLNKTVDFPIKLPVPKLKPNLQQSVHDPGQFTSVHEVANTKDFEFQPHPQSIHYDDEILGDDAWGEDQYEDMVHDINLIPMDLPLDEDGTVVTEGIEPPIEGAQPVVLLDDEGNLTMWYFTATPKQKKKSKKLDFSSKYKPGDVTKFPSGSIQQSEYSKLVHYGGSSPGWIILHNKEDSIKDSWKFSPNTPLSYTTNNQSIQEILSHCAPTDYRVFKGFTIWKTDLLVNSLIKSGKLISAQAPHSLIFTNELNSKRINLSDPVLKTNENDKVTSKSPKEKKDRRSVTPLAGLWSHLLGLMGGEFWHFAHADHSFHTERMKTPKKLDDPQKNE